MTTTQNKLHVLLQQLYEFHSRAQENSPEHVGVTEVKQETENQRKACVAFTQKAQVQLGQLALWQWQRQQMEHSRV